MGRSLGVVRPVLLALALILATAFAGCGGSDEQPRSDGFAAAATTAVRDVREPGAALLDVRTRAEVAEGKAPGAIHLPLARIEKGARPDVAKDARIYVYCRTGRRAGTAVKILREAGFKDVTNIGGLRDWERAGGDVAR